MEYHSKEMDIGLMMLVDGVRDAMIKKLKEKYDEGYGGWDNVNMVDDIWQSLEEHVLKGCNKENMLDIINLAAFLWNMADDARYLGCTPIVGKVFKELFNGEGSDT